MKKITFVCPYCEPKDFLSNAAQGESFALASMPCPACSIDISGRVSFDNFIPVTRLMDGSYADVVTVLNESGLVYCQIKPFCRDEYDSGVNPHIRAYQLDFKYDLSELSALKKIEDMGKTNE